MDVRFRRRVAVRASGTAGLGAGTEGLVDDGLDGAGATAAFGAAAEAAIDLLGIAPSAIRSADGVADIMVGQDVTGANDHQNSGPKRVARAHRYLRPRQDAKGKSVFSSDSKLIPDPDWNESKNPYGSGTTRVSGQRRRTVNRCYFRLHHHRRRYRLLRRSQPKNRDPRSHYNDQMRNDGHDFRRDGLHLQRRKYPQRSVQGHRPMPLDFGGGISAGSPGRSKSATSRRPRPRISACRSTSFPGSRRRAKRTCGPQKTPAPATICRGMWRRCSLIIQAKCGTFPVTECLSAVLAP